MLTKYLIEGEFKINKFDNKNWQNFIYFKRKNRLNSSFFDFLLLKSDENLTKKYFFKYLIKIPGF